MTNQELAETEALLATLIGETADQLRRIRGELTEALDQLKKLKLLRHVVGASEMTKQEKRDLKERLPTKLDSLRFEVHRLESRLETLESSDMEATGGEPAAETK